MAFTFFFRDLHTLERAVTCFLPNAIGCQSIRVWDAGCATGQEPFTLAMLCAEQMGYFAFKNLRIDATDIDECDKFHINLRDGVYPMAGIMSVPDLFREKYFDIDPITGMATVRAFIRERVSFYKHDLRCLTPIKSGYNLIICKNVLLHLSYTERLAVSAMFYEALIPGGFLVLEQTQRIPNELESHFEQVVPDARIYRKTRSEPCSALLWTSVEKAVPMKAEVVSG